MTMAFQPIVNCNTASIFAYEALLRGTDGAGAGAILSQVTNDNRYAFDQSCRVTAIELAAELGMAQDGAFLSINFLPNAVYEPKACIRLTLETAMRTGFPVDRILFEFTEVERLDTAHVLNILRTYRSLGFKTAIDDFGAGFAGLDLLSKFQPDVVKLDMGLVRAIDQSRVKRIMVKNILNMVQDLGIVLVCEGVETQAEFEVLSDFGVELMQGYFFAEPEIKSLPKPVWPNLHMKQAAAS
ncbi:EAL domain-containing protein [Pararhizobium sp. IMCC21322]|uniref:EAL domain-containing protein n=1 Tax=Pararhizobium sp. IMCC21322 TaxID=3067903 RepID=UPI0027417B63|nr:EAL domain-containing protein [Pararhizobium sp. IMCC21322]